MEVHNPLIPAGYDIAWSSVAILTFVLLIVALVSLVRTARRLTGTQALLWTAIILFVPVVGPLCWMLIGRRAAAPPSGSA
ncbi:PLD nuclease N-terminal domain-containing protein [Microbacterium phyllosphaerae]|uniref:PLD nuclease N-terminal domain-containing protein n=1 Tax=Microbacterium phyllosphaerae TaxID=124798 RepID=UPI003D654C73